MRSRRVVFVQTVHICIVGTIGDSLGLELLVAAVQPIKHTDFVSKEKVLHMQR